MTKITVNTAKKYDVIIDSGLLSDAGTLAASALRAKKLAIVTDDRVNSLYGEKVTVSFVEAGFETCLYVIPHGERSKNAREYINILEFLTENRLTRSDAVAALGGGVVGDLAGFAAATYLRGIDFIQLPTTLLAAVDSSVGGKTGIDLGAGKNLAGAFWQPSLVICDTEALDTLPDSEMRGGCSEVVKYGILGDRALFDHIAAKKTEFDRAAVISECVRMKAGYAEADEHDFGRRQQLNLGHTVGHAAEKLSGYKLTHGEAVAAGMCVIARACAANKICSRDTADEICACVRGLRHPVTVPFGAGDLYDVMLSDKKRDNGGINIITILEIGQCEAVRMNGERLLGFVASGL